MTILAGVVLMSLASPAQAQFRLRVEDVGTGVGVVITDNGPGDQDPLVGSVIYSSIAPGVAIGGFTVQVTAGVSKPIIGGVNNFAELDLNNISANSSGAGHLRLSLEDTGFTGGAPGGLILVGTVGGTLTAATGSTITVSSWANGANLVPAYGSDTGTTPTTLSALGAIPAGSENAFGPGGVTFGPGAFSTTGSVGFIAGASYSIFAQVDIIFTGPGTVVSFDENQQVLPAPGGLVLALAALPVFGIRYLRRRFRKTA
jgi:hypothetical protein